MIVLNKANDRMLKIVNSGWRVRLPLQWKTCSTYNFVYHFYRSGDNCVTTSLCHAFKVPNVSGEHLLQSNYEVANVSENRQNF